MYVKNKGMALTDSDGGVVRKVLTYSENLMSVELHSGKEVVEAKHFHPHEQTGHLISDSLLLQEAGGKDKVPAVSDTYYIELDVERSVVALEGTMLLDTFTLVRKDSI